MAESTPDFVCVPRPDKVNELSRLDFVEKTALIAALASVTRASQMLRGRDCFWLKALAGDMMALHEKEIETVA